MTVEQFLDQISAKGLLTAEQLARVRSQVAKSAKPVSPKALAKHLVDTSLLTLSQAQQLLSAPAAESKPTVQKPVTAPKPKPAADDFGLTPLDDDMGLAPLETLEALEPLPTAAKAKPAATPASPKKQPAAPQLEPIEADASSLLEELGELDVASSLGGPLGGGGPLDLLSSSAALVGQGDPLLPAPAKKKGLAGLFGSSEPKKKKKGESEWESPLILFGGGALLLMIIIGVAVFFLYARGSGDDMFRLAEEDYKGGSYTQAIGKYTQYLEKFPTHPSVSFAKVHLGLAKLRQATEHTTDYGHALEVAESVVHEIENEKEFSDARSELRSLFPDIAEGLAKEAGQEKEPEKVKAKLELVQKALNLLSNPKYVPDAQRPMQRINEIREMMTVAQRDLDRDAELTKTIEAMQKSASSGEIAAAYAARKQLLKSYPDLLANEVLATAVLAVAKGEQTAVKAMAVEGKTANKEAESPIIASVALAATEGGGKESGRSLVVLVDGAVYALDSGSGKLLWRRHVGADAAPPLAIDMAAESSDVVLVDAARGELVRVVPDSGKLVWRLPIEGRISGTAITGKQALVTTREGKLTAVDLKTGAAKLAVALPQGLRLAPAIHERLPKLYQVGEQSSLYVLGTADLACQQVFYLGHESGTVRVPPFVLPKHLIVADNHGARSCTLHVLALADDGSIAKEAQHIELVGNVITAPVLADRKLVVMTDAGHIKVMGVNAANPDQPLTDLADQPAAANSKALVRHLLVEGGNLWIADKQLVRYKVQSAAGRLMPSALDDNYENAIFDHPLISLEKSLVHIRRPLGSPGALVAASALQDGHKLWETQIATPPAGEPITDGNSLAIVTAPGQLFSLATSDIKQPAMNEAATKPNVNPDSPPVLTSRVDLASNRYAFASSGSKALLIAQASAGKFTSTWLKLADALACPPAKFGKGLIAPTRIGQVFWLDSAKGKQVAAPFQPRVSAGETIPWTTPDATADGKELVIADGQSHVYRLGVQKEPAPHLVPLATSDDVGQPLVTPIAVLDSIAVAADADGNLHVFKLPDLAAAENVDLGGSITWGPRRIGKNILITTANDELLCLDGDAKPIWRQSLQDGPLAGTPALVEGELVIASLGGRITRLAADTGKLLGSVEIGQPVATGPVAVGKNWAVAGRDGTLLVVKSPSGETTVAKASKDDAETDQ